MPIFSASDPRFETWTHRNPDGYVLVTTRNPKPLSLVLHSARCDALAEVSSTPQSSDEYMRLCSVRYEDIRQWVDAQGFGRPPIETCSHCKVAEPNLEMEWWPWCYPILRHGRDPSAWASEQDTPLFASRVTLRPLTIVIEAHLLERSNEDPIIEYLLELTQTQPIRRFFYGGDDPPPDAVAYRVPWSDSIVADGWLLSRSGRHDHIRDIYYIEDNKIHSRGYWLKDPRHIFLEILPTPKSYQNDVQASERMRDDLHRLLAAETINADLLVTDRDYLLENNLKLAESTSAVSPTIALRLVGLYLRLQNIYKVNRFSRLGRGLFYEAAMREMIPASWSWAGGCALLYQAGNDPDLVFLSGSTLDRASRALRSRDRLLAASSVPQNEDTADEVLAELDQICLSLMGALDASAQIAHLLFDLAGDHNYAAWQRDSKGGWLNKLKSHNEELASLVSEGSRGKNVLTILGEVRNTIHGQSLSPARFETESRRIELFALLPVHRRRKVLDAIDASGGRLAWGVYGLSDETYRVHPGEFGDQLLSETLYLVNQLMESMSIDDLLNSDQRSKLPKRPIDASNPYSEYHGQRVRWQLGL